MTEERDEPQEKNVQLPDDAVPDLEPDEEESRDVQGGVYEWWKKT